MNDTFVPKHIILVILYLCCQIYHDPTLLACTLGPDLHGLPQLDFLILWLPLVQLMASVLAVAVFLNRWLHLLLGGLPLTAMDSLACTK